MKKDITVIIPNFNGADIIEKCLRYLEAQNYKGFEILVIDDASKDNSVELIKKHPVRLIENKTNMGFAYSVNEGIKESDTEFVLLLNNDVFILDPNFLDNMVKTIKINPLIFSVSAKMISYLNPIIIDDTGDQYTILGWVYKRGNGQYIRDYTKNSLVFSACAGAGLYRREVFNQIGLFDPLHFAYLEDVDIGWRAQIYGYMNVYSADSECYHLGSQTFAQGQKYSSLKVKLSARNNIYIIYKNMPTLQLTLNLPFLVLGFGIKVLYFYYYGFGKDYIDGIIEGFKTVHQLKKVPVLKENKKNYKHIQKEMFICTKKYLNLKSKQFALKIKRKVDQKLESIQKLLKIAGQASS